MNIYTVTRDFLEPVRHLFAGHSVEVLPRTYRETYPFKSDLLVFTGGEDVFPERYGMYAPKNQGTWFNMQRDDWEFKVLRDFQMERISGKVLGICRGLQVLNVAFGGDLVYDIATSFDRGHPPTHKLSWVNNSPLAEMFPVVNSMHHQAARRIGSSRPCAVLATEPTTNLPEALCWEEKYLGVQFHPEFMTGEAGSTSFVGFLERWVAGQASVNPPKTSRETPSSRKPRVSKLNFYEISEDSNG